MKLQKKLALILVITALVPLFTVISVALYHSLETTEKLSLEIARRTVDTGAEKLSGYFAQRLAEIGAYAGGPTLRTMDFKRIAPFLNRELARHRGEYEKFVLGRPDGTFYNTAGGNPYLGGVRTFADDDPLAKPKSIAERDYWQVTVGENSRNESRRYVSNPMISMTTGVQQIVVAASILDDQQHVVGMIGGALQWDRIAQLIDEVHREIVSEYHNEARFLLVTSNGDYLYHWDPAKTVKLLLDGAGQPVQNESGENISVSSKITEDPLPAIARNGAAMLQGQSGIEQFFDPAINADAFLVYAPVESAGYSVGLILPRQVVVGPVDRLRTVFISFSLVVGALVILGAPLISRQLTSPVAALSRLTQRIAQGQLGTRARVDRNDELGALARAFNQMAKSLEERESDLRSAHDKLEQAVQKRTSQLREEIASKESIEQQLKLECARAQNYLDVAGVMLLILRSDQTVELINKKGCELTGYAEDELVGKNWFDFCVPGDKRETARAAFVDSLAPGASMAPYFECDIVCKDGSRRIIAWRNIAVRDSTGNVVSVVSSGDDITERRRINQIKRDFVSIVSHELRTPLTSIRGALGLLNSLHTVSLPPEASHLLDIASRNVERLVLLINDILDIEKIESGRLKFDLKPLNIAPIIQQSIESNRAYGQQFGVRYVLRDQSNGASATVDALRLQQVMSNLLSNAAKFSPPNNEVEIDVERANGSVRVSVKDRGPGIPEEFKEQIFQKFCQADPSTTRSKGGTGLGLTIAKALIERMGGNIDFLSVRDQGTTFFFELPIAGES